MACGSSGSARNGQIAPSRKGSRRAQSCGALDASLGAEYQDTDDDRWLPIVCAYQGCRQEEACQLMKSDIWQHDSGVWVMRITDAGQDQEKVKNDPSIRTIPLHTKLIERGFLQHVARSSWSAGLRFVEA